MPSHNPQKDANVPREVRIIEQYYGGPLGLQEDIDSAHDRLDGLQFGAYSVDGINIMSNGHPLHIRGVNHYGWAGVIHCPQQIWAMEWRDMIQQVKDLGFNAIRVALGPGCLHDPTPINTLTYMGLNPDWIGLDGLHALDQFLDEMNRQGLYILLDIHSVRDSDTLYSEEGLWYITDPANIHLTWNGEEYTEQDWIDDWVFMVERWAHLPYLMGCDLFNEPHGLAVWDTGGDATKHWKTAVENCSEAILAANPNVLIFMEGIDWGQDFTFMVTSPPDPEKVPPNKLVLSPHQYGPDNFYHSFFDDPSFPDNLAPMWEDAYGYLQGEYMVLPGEWGGHYGTGGGYEIDVIWEDTWVDWMLEKGMMNFYWSYTFSDIGSVLNFDNEVVPEILELIERSWGD